MTRVLVIVAFAAAACAMGFRQRTCQVLGGAQSLRL